MTPFEAQAATIVALEAEIARLQQMLRGLEAESDQTIMRLRVDNDRLRQRLAELETGKRT